MSGRRFSMKFPVPAVITALAILKGVATGAATSDELRV
jgi:hypothetical protein